MLYLNGRGWTDEDWVAASERLEQRGLLRGERLTAEGRTQRDWIESRTDELAARPLRAIDDVDALIHDLDVAARAVVDADEIRFPNPMGLPRLDAGTGSASSI